MTIRISFYDKTVRVAVEINGAIESKITELPQRKWVGLTDAEKNGCLVSADPCECLATPEAQQLMEDVETKLKEKNT